MVTSAFRRQAALDAISQVVAGALPADAETELVDFKLEEGRRRRSGALVSIGSQHEPAAMALAREAACFANTTKGGCLVVGVDDRTPGAPGLVGAESDQNWLRQRIYALTQPSLTVEIEVEIQSGARLLIINVPDALQEISVGGRLRTRMGTDCVELTGDRAREFLEARRGYDWSAEPSGWRLSQAHPDAMASAIAHYTRRQGAAAIGAADLAARLRLLVDDAADPELNRAGALLLCPIEPTGTQIDLLVTLAEGAASRRRLTLPAPLMTAYDRVMLVLLDEVFPARARVVAGENQLLRYLPELAIRESIVNAMMHRDYRLDRATILALALGDPTDVFKVRSPGGLPAGVSVRRLLAVQSTPRNRTLTGAIRGLGLAEGEGVGIDSMYHTMLRDGHPTPEITDDGGEVVVRLAGGAPDLRVRTLFDLSARRQKSLGEDVRAAIAIDLLTRQAVLRPVQLAEASQSTLGDAARTLDLMLEAQVVERLLDGSRSYRLTAPARSMLVHRIRYRPRTSLDDRMAEVDALLDVMPTISRADLVDRLGMTNGTAGRVRREMVKAGRLVGTTRIRRGPNMRYRRPAE